MQETRVRFHALIRSTKALTNVDVVSFNLEVINADPFGKEMLIQLMYQTCNLLSLLT